MRRHEDEDAPGEGKRLKKGAIWFVRGREIERKREGEKHAVRSNEYTRVFHK